MQRWQKFTTMVYEINKSRDLKERTGNHIWKKVFESTIMTEKRISWYMHIIFLTKILGIFAISLNPIIIQNWIKQEAQRANYCAPEYNVPHLLPHLGFLLCLKNTNFVEDIEILLSINFPQIQFSGFRAVLSKQAYCKYCWSNTCPLPAPTNFKEA